MTSVSGWALVDEHGNIVPQVAPAPVLPVAWGIFRQEIFARHFQRGNQRVVRCTVILEDK